MHVILADENAQVAFGTALGEALAGRGQVHLEGELGAGKTTLTRGILRAYGYQGAVKSPTYTLVEPYVVDGVQVHHFDLYRLGDPDELEFIGARDLFDGDSLCLVEWPSRGEGWLPAPDLHLAIEVLEQGRRVVLSAHGDYGKTVLARMARIESPAWLADSQR